MRAVALRISIAVFYVAGGMTSLAQDKKLSSNLLQAIDVCILMAKVRELTHGPDSEYQGKDISNQPFAIMGCDDNAARELTDKLIAEGIEGTVVKSEDGSRTDYHFGAPLKSVAVCRRFGTADLCDFMYPDKRKTEVERMQLNHFTDEISTVDLVPINENIRAILEKQMAADTDED